MSTATIAATTNAIDLVLGMGRTTTKAKPAKAKVEVDDTLVKMLDEYFEHDKLAKSHKAMADTARDQVVAQAKPLFYHACLMAGKALSSVKVGKGTMTVTNNYSLIDAAEGQALSEAFGDNYPSYFRRSIELTVSKEASNNDEFLNDLIQRVGVEFFQKNFIVKSGIRVTDALHTALSLSATARMQAQPFLDGQVIKPYSPSIKLA